MRNGMLARMSRENFKFFDLLLISRDSSDYTQLCFVSLLLPFSSGPTFNVSITDFHLNITSGCASYLSSMATTSEIFATWRHVVKGIAASLRYFTVYSHSIKIHSIYHTLFSAFVMLLPPLLVTLRLSTRPAPGVLKKSEGPWPSSTMCDRYPLCAESR